MARLIPTAERITLARALIQKARDYPVPPEGGRGDFSYIAQVKDLLRQARDMVKFVAYNPGIPPDLKAEAASIFTEADQAQKEILHP